MAWCAVCGTFFKRALLSRSEGRYQFRPLIQLPACLPPHWSSIAIFVVTVQSTVLGAGGGRGLDEG